MLAFLSGFVLGWLVAMVGVWVVYALRRRDTNRANRVVLHPVGVNQPIWFDDHPAMGGCHCACRHIHPVPDRDTLGGNHAADDSD